MNSAGHVAVGGGIPSSSYDLSTGKLSASGDVYFSQYLSSIIFDSFTSGYYPAKRMRPTSNNVSQLGHYMYGFNVIFSYSYATPSDKRQKENVRPLSKSLDKIKALNGVKYDLKKGIYTDKENKINLKNDAYVEKDRKDKIGFLAQDVFEVLPEVVLYDDSTDVYAIDYIKIIPILVEAMKEQQVQIAELQAQLSGNGSKGKRTENEEEDVIIDATQLILSKPNPFRDQTEVSFMISENTQDANLYIYDLQGTQVKSYPINQRGSGSITIQGN
ncbi:MAG: hypothetical protein ACI93L_002381, partial [Cyclobacteriaceae bacterium]